MWSTSLQFFINSKEDESKKKIRKNQMKIFQNDELVMGSKVTKTLNI